MILQLPEEAYGQHSIIFLVGILVGLLGYGTSKNIQNRKQGLHVKVASIVMMILTTLGLVGTMAFNVHIDNMEKESNITYIENTTKELGDRLTGTTTVAEFNSLVRDLYQAEYTLAERDFSGKEDLTTIGELLLKGNGTDIGDYFSGLTQDERMLVLETNNTSLNTFTEVEFANMDSQIKRESLKLGNTGSIEVLKYMDDQKAVLESKLDKLETTNISFGRIVQNTIVVTVALALLSLGLTTVMYVMVVDMLKELKEQSEKRQRYIGTTGVEDGKVDSETEESNLEEFDLVDGELKEPEEVSEEFTEDEPVYEPVDEIEEDREEVSVDGTVESATIEDTKEESVDVPVEEASESETISPDDKESKSGSVLKANDTKESTQESGKDEGKESTK